MAVSKPILKDCRHAGADLSNALNLLVKLDGSGNLVLCSASDKPYGSVYEAAPQGKGVTVDCKGIIKVKLGGTVVAGGRVTTGASGVCVAISGDDTGFAVAREGGGSGTIISIATD